MSFAKGYYGLIQYCPDQSRAEAANVGVALFCPALGYLGARTSQGNDRVRRFFGTGSFDPKRLNAAKKAIEARIIRSRSSIRTVEEFEQLIQSRGNELLITMPRPIKLIDPNKELDTLYDELVGARKRKSKHVLAQQDTVAELLDSRFRRMSDRIRFKHKIRLPVMERDFEVDYAYRNGSLNLIKTEAFSQSLGKAFNQATKLAVIGDLLRKTPADEGVQRRLTVVSLGIPGAPAQVERDVGELLADYKTGFVPAKDVGEFVVEVEKEAHT